MLGYMVCTFTTPDIKYLSIFRGNICRYTMQQTWPGVIIAQVQNAVSYRSGNGRKSIPTRVQYRP